MRQLQLVLIGAVSLVYAAPRSAHVPMGADGLVRPQDVASAILDTLSGNVAQDVTDDGMLMLAGVVRVETATDGSMHVEVAYGGDFDRDMVLTIPRPASFDESGQVVGIRGPDRIRLLDDAVVYIFDPVADEGKSSNTTRAVVVDGPSVADGCEFVMSYPEWKSFCEKTGECSQKCEPCPKTKNGKIEVSCDCSCTSAM